MEMQQLKDYLKMIYELEKQKYAAEQIFNTINPICYMEVSGTIFIFTDNRDAVKDIEN